ncbi:MAG: Autoinducer 2 sensor kinase/phosphatase LuxQ [bacterium ADurb.Bin243]|nr:MAG: Autoinducer 2 sensor kinase/phosphatase LuxQ [bacterium ADurb.Bin243]
MAGNQAAMDEIARLRWVAEQKSLNEENNAEQNLSIEDARRLVHELRVHQIELEMQNDELRRTRHELELSVARYFELYDLAPNGYLSIDEKGVITQANLTLANLLGLQRNELVKKHFTDYIYSEDQDIYYHYRKNLFKKPFSGNCELRLKRKDSSCFWARLESLTACDEQGAMVCRTAVSDINYLKTIEESLIAAREKAEAANIAKSRFLANVTHELRTPLNAIIGFSQLVSMSGIDDRQAELVGWIKYSSNNLLEIINDIMDFSKIEAKKLKLEKNIFDINDIAEKTVKMMSILAEKKKIELGYEIDPAINYKLYGDPFRIKQIIVNLIANAIKFTSKGEVKVKIYESEKKENVSNVSIEVSDTGIGISSDDVDEIFERFYQVDDSSTRRYGGTGLGLSIVKGIVEMLNGKIFVESRLGSGSRFVVTIPFDMKEKASKSLKEPETAV